MTVCILNADLHDGNTCLVIICFRFWRLENIHKWMQMNVCQPNPLSATKLYTTNWVSSSVGQLLLLPFKSTDRHGFSWRWLMVTTVRASVAMRESPGLPYIERWAHIQNVRPSIHFKSSRFHSNYHFRIKSNVFHIQIISFDFLRNVMKKENSFCLNGFIISTHEGGNGTLYFNSIEL